MRQKQFEAATLDEALAKVRRELGPDAVVLATREIPPLNKLGLGRGRVRVTAAVDYERGSYESILPNLPKRPALDEALARAPVSRSSQPLQERMALRGAVGAKDARLQDLIRQISVRPPPWREGGPKIALLQGTSGVGKTVTAAKIAAQARHYHGTDTGLLCVDSVRIGAFDQLGSYADILQIPFAACDSPRQIAKALKKLRACSLIIVDTPALNPRAAAEMEQVVQWQQALGSRRSLESLMVVAATESVDDQVASCRALRRQNAVDSLIFTKLDQTENPGRIVRTLVASTLPVSLMTGSKQVFGQLLPAQPESVARLAMQNAA